MFESLHDSVDVLTAHVGGTIRPLRFRWRGKVHRVGKVTGEWNRIEGSASVRFYSVETVDGASFELRYDPRGGGWKLCKAWNPG